MKGAAKQLFGNKQAGDESENWLTVSDLMAGLMMVFLFISVALMYSAFAERDNYREIQKAVKDLAEAYHDSRVAIYEALIEEFGEDELREWGVEINPKKLSFEFRSPEVLFKTQETSLRPRFMKILDVFFPRYLDVLKDHKEAIEEVHIEGHTSSKWEGATTEKEAYFKNMELSQGRTRSVLQYVYKLPEVAEDREWVKAKVAAVGFSSSRLVLDDGGAEDEEASRRVLFRVVTNAEKQIGKILEQIPERISEE